MVKALAEPMTGGRRRGAIRECAIIERADIQPARMKENMTEKDDKHSVQAWAASLVNQCREQLLRQKFPEATDAEIKVLWRAQ